MIRADFDMERLSDRMIALILDELENPERHSQLQLLKPLFKADLIRVLRAEQTRRLQSPPGAVTSAAFQLLPTREEIIFGACTMLNYADELCAVAKATPDFGEALEFAAGAEFTKAVLATFTSQSLLNLGEMPH